MTEDIKGQTILNTGHFSVLVQENEQGVSIEIYHRHGDLIETFTYWNEDTLEND